MKNSPLICVHCTTNSWTLFSQTTLMKNASVPPVQSTSNCSAPNHVKEQISLTTWRSISCSLGTWSGRLCKIKSSLYFWFLKIQRRNAVLAKHILNWKDVKREKIQLTCIVTSCWSLHICQIDHGIINGTFCKRRKSVNVLFFLFWRRGVAFFHNWKISEKARLCFPDFKMRNRTLSKNEKESQDCERFNSKQTMTSLTFRFLFLFCLLWSHFCKQRKNIYFLQEKFQGHEKTWKVNEKFLPLSSSSLETDLFDLGFFGLATAETDKDKFVRKANPLTSQPSLWKAEPNDKSKRVCFQGNNFLGPTTWSGNQKKRTCFPQTHKKKSACLPSSLSSSISSSCSWLYSCPKRVKSRNESQAKQKDVSNISTGFTK